MMANCIHIVRTMTSRLGKRSEIQPAVGEKRRKGNRISAARVVLISLASASGSPWVTAVTMC